MCVGHIKVCSLLSAAEPYFNNTIIIIVSTFYTFIGVSISQPIITKVRCHELKVCTFFLSGNIACTSKMVCLHFSNYRVPIYLYIVWFNINYDNIVKSSLIDISYFSIMIIINIYTFSI